MEKNFVAISLISRLRKLISLCSTLDLRKRQVSSGLCWAEGERERERVCVCERERERKPGAQRSHSAAFLKYNTDI